jgi:hypothetical protein
MLHSVSTKHMKFDFIAENQIKSFNFHNIFNILIAKNIQQFENIRK